MSNKAEPERRAAAAALAFGILGDLEAQRAGERIELGGHRQRAVLALLLIEANHVVSIDRMAEELWGGRPPPRATGTLIAYISRLRRALEPGRPRGGAGEVLVTQPPGYLLRLEHDQLDSRRFERLTGEGRAALAAGDAKRAQALLSEALSLWRGPALAEFADESFAQGEAARLEDLRLCTIEDRLEAELALGRHAALVAELESLVAAHPLRERLRGQLMLALYRSGRQAEALAAYRSGRELLSEELGIEPDPKLRALQQAILEQREELDWRSPTAERAGMAATPATGNGKGPSVAAAAVLVGRRRERAVLEQALEQACAGRGRVVLLSGEPGIGKTRLAEEVARSAAAADAEVVWGRCFEGEGAPAFWPWTEVLRATVERTEPAVLRAALGPYGADVAQVVPELRELLPGEEPARLLDPEVARFRLCDSLGCFLRRLAQERPLAIILEDLQWADAPSLQLLAFLPSRLREASILIAGTYRDVEVSPSHPLADALADLAREPAVTRLELQGLGHADVARLAANVTNRRASESLAATLHRRTDGNPFFVSELLRLLEAEREAEAAAWVRIPGGVRDVVRRRLSRLPDESLTLLTQAAVAGEEFDLALVARLCGIDEEAALDRVEAALVHRIVSEQPDAVGRYRFSHALIRETVYEQLSAMRRARLHRRVGDVLEELDAEDEDRLSELAFHFYEGAPAGGGEKAFAYALRAAEHALGRLAYEQAEDQLHRALELLDKMPAGPDRAEREVGARLWLSTLLTMTRGYADPQVAEACAKAVQAARKTGSERQLLHPLWRLSTFHVLRAEFRAAEKLGDELLDVGRRSQERAFLLAGHEVLGMTALNQGGLTAARAHLDQAVAIHDTLDDPSLLAVAGHDHGVVCRDLLACTLALLGEERDARELVREALELAERRGHAHTEAVARCFDAWMASFERDGAAALTRASKALDLCGERGFRLWGAIAAILHGWALAECGEPEAGAAQVDEGLAAMESSGARMLRHFFLALFAEAQWRAGRPQDALTVVEQGLAEVDAVGERSYEAELHRLRGELVQALSPERADDAETSLRTAVTVARAQQAGSLERRAQASLHRLLDR